MIDDALAFRLPDGGWIGIAVERGLVWAVIALAFWAGVVFANRWLMPRLGLDLRRQSFWLGLAGAACIIGSSAAGAIHFVAEKPFM
jgi:hypothetical protein